MAEPRNQITFDFRDHPRLLDILRLTAAREKTTQKAIVVNALTAYFSHKQENPALLLAADKAFSEWNNEEDRVYDSL